MGSSASSQKKESVEHQARRQLLLQRKVTTDILEKLARVLPTVTNPLGKTLKLDKDSVTNLQWKANLSYLEDWKKWKKDEATIGNLINLLKAATHKPEDYECLFNISREPKNATTATDRTLESPKPSPTPRKKEADFLSKEGNALLRKNPSSSFQNQPIKSRLSYQKSASKTPNLGFNTPYQPVPIQYKPDSIKSHHSNKISETPFLTSFSQRQQTPYKPDSVKSYHDQPTPTSTKVSHKTQPYIPYSNQNQPDTNPITPLSTKISQKTEPHKPNIETPFPTTVNAKSEKSPDNKVLDDYFTTLNTSEPRDSNILNSGSKPNYPVFLTEEKQLSPQHSNLQSRNSSDTQHPWIDYRDWGRIDTTWTFGQVDQFEQFDANSQLKIGNYLPGIVKLNQMIVVSDTNEKMLHYFTSSGQHYKSVSTGNLTPGGMCSSGIDTVAVCCGTVVAIWNNNGQYMGEFGRGIFDWCRGICMDQNDRYIVTDIEANTVTIHSKDGQMINRLQTNETNHFNRPYYTTVNHRNQILVSDSRNHCIKIFDKNGSYLSKFGSFGGGPSQFRVPLGVITDCCGNVLISDYGNNRVSMYSSGGWFLKHILTRENQIGQSISITTISKRKLVLSTMGQNYLNVFEFLQMGERVSPLLDYLQ